MKLFRFCLIWLFIGFVVLFLFSVNTALFMLGYTGGVIMVAMLVLSFWGD